MMGVKALKTCNKDRWTHNKQGIILLNTVLAIIYTTNEYLKAYPDFVNSVTDKVAKRI